MVREINSIEKELENDMDLSTSTRHSNEMDVGRELEQAAYSAENAFKSVSKSWSRSTERDIER